MRRISARLAVKGLYVGKTLPAMDMVKFIETFGQSAEARLFIETWFRKGRDEPGGSRRR